MEQTLTLTPQQRARLERELVLRREYARRQKELINAYGPYKKQAEFHALGAHYTERAFFAGNQLGKTLSAACETAYHLTGLYPDWWKGRRFTKAPVLWVGGDTGETIRDTSQRLLFDRPGKLMDSASEYLGIIPQRYVMEKPRAAMGTPDLFDHVKIKHVSGTIAYLYFKAYAKGRQKWQGETVDGVWFDEEPPEEIYSEGLTRTNKGQVGQFAYLTFTPLLGMSKVVHKFLKNPSPSQVSLTMTIEDVDHYTREEKDTIIASYPEHEREARALGLPLMGSGRIFPLAMSDVKCRPIFDRDIPEWWRQIVGIDFGWDHPTASVRLAHDSEADRVHVVAAYRKREVTPLEFCSGISHWPKWIPVAWPHDGLQHDKGSGEQLAKQYERAGLRMLPEKATFEDGSNGVEAGISLMLEMMRTGRLKVDETLTEWWEEFNMYHREKGKIIKERDDLISATRYAIMMLREAQSFTEAKRYIQPEESWKKKLRQMRGGVGNRPRGSMVA